MCVFSRRSQVKRRRGKRLIRGLVCGGGVDLLSTPTSAPGVVATAGDGRSGRSGDVSGCEGAGLVNGREDGAILQNGGAVVDERRSLSGSDNAVLIPSSSNSDGVHKVDGRHTSYVFNRAPLVSFGGTSSQVDGKLVIGKVSQTLFSESDAKASRETIVPLGRSADEC
ncbi:hypothetical protein ACSQ67_008702 [Phaseolus vulgaris]